MAITLTHPELGTSIEVESEAKANVLKKSGWIEEHEAESEEEEELNGDTDV